MTDGDPVLELDGLEKRFRGNRGIVSRFLGDGRGDVVAVDDVSLTLGGTEVQGIIGESGCGKSTLLRTVMGLYDPTGGTIRFRGEDTADYGRGDWKTFRENVQIIFQDPFNSLNPKMTVRETLTEPLSIHGIGDRTERVASILEDVELEPAEQYLDQKPAQLSGGEKQRVSIARALVTEPDVVLADEPLSMLDVSTQASILNLLTDLLEDRGLSMLYISHDLSTVSYICGSINVMYLGRFVESAETEALLGEPKHPYTEALVDAVPIPDPNHGRGRTTLDGTPRDPIELGEGCRFRDRCPERMDVCEKTPRTVDADDGSHRVACHLYYDHEASTDGDPAHSDVADESGGAQS